jgi:hypothetical protein
MRRDLCLIGISQTASTGLILIPLLFGAPAWAAGKIYYGSRAGMTVTVRSMSDLDTSHAKIITEHTKDDAIGFCRDYAQEDPVTENCIRQELAVRLNDVITADCPRARSQTSTGRNTSFEERIPAQETSEQNIYL